MIADIVAELLNILMATEASQPIPPSPSRPQKGLGKWAQCPKCNKELRRREMFVCPQSSCPAGLD
jgi:hypothetical protein